MTNYSPQQQLSNAIKHAQWSTHMGRLTHDPGCDGKVSEASLQCACGLVDEKYMRMLIESMYHFKQGKSVSTQLKHPGKLRGKAGESREAKWLRRQNQLTAYRDASHTLEHMRHKPARSVLEHHYWLAFG